MEHNWSENIDFSSATLAEPTSMTALQRAVTAAQEIRSVGSGHSFNPIAATTGTLLSLASMPPRFEVGADGRSVTVNAAMRYGELGPLLDEHGLALANMASLPFFTVAGACATATHGSGDRNQSLAAAVRGLELVTAHGDVIARNVDDHPEDLAAMTVGLGAFGVITALTLAVEGRYEMAQAVDLDVPFQSTIERLDEVMSDAYSVSLFTDWRDGTINHVWRKYRLDHDPEPDRDRLDLGGSKLVRQLAEFRTDQVMTPGPWFERLPHIRMARPDRPAFQLQSEYFVARNHAAAALTALAGHADAMVPAMQTGVLAEIRTVAADDAWLSPFAEDTLAIHISWDPNPAIVEPLLPTIEEVLAPFEPRPHWGKLYAMAPGQVRSCYPAFDRWANTVAAYDPSGRFRNDYLTDLLNG